ncbi:MAG: rhodanese-like domain-containing protein [Balneolaceae bacterium]|nr:rhodanese-like domain-containing protein [Balneolaceae bacterium]
MFNLFSSSTGVDISTEEFKQKLEKEPGVVLDVRTSDEYNAGHLKITDAQYDFLNGDFQNQIVNLEKDKTYYLYCRSGNRSGQAARIMQKEGFENVYNVGGFEELVDAGFEPNGPDNE